MTTITAQVQEIEEEEAIDGVETTVDAENDTDSDETNTEAEATIKAVPQRVRRVTTDVTLPEQGSTVGNIALDVVGSDTIINYPVDFSTLDTEFLQQAVLAGMVTRLGIAYSGKTDPQEIVDAINAEIKNFNEGKFISRSSGEKSSKVPDIVIAWIRAVNKNPDDKVVVATYGDAWKNKSDSEKEKIRKNELVATIFEEIQYAKRMAKVEKEAVDDASVLEL